MNLGGGANRKWDTSRAERVKVTNPNNVDLAAVFGANLPSSHTFTNFPSDPVVGNDDTGVGPTEEDNDPYTKDQWNNVDKGIILDNDNVSRLAIDAVGAVGDSFQLAFHFKSFARLELGGKWVRISDDVPWQVVLKFKKVSEPADNTDYNSDGDKQDVLWIDDGSTRAADNNGW